jgi:hypothetical protein
MSIPRVVEVIDAGAQLEQLHCIGYLRPGTAGGPRIEPAGHVFWPVSDGCPDFYKNWATGSHQAPSPDARDRKSSDMSYITFVEKCFKGVACSCHLILS